ncbi:23361_t:CDS:2 [Gigaspora margarita]|uniref:23361_t:CDS:1 n=1 Tax=Gigaspora margarita TaxID=4874 RepID=A0ABN7UES4_GIGMA|nr:23361_t:CDS:2 [Gigaspora margarita]
MKFHIRILNFFPSLTPNDHIFFTYIALGQVVKNNSFYASLHMESIVTTQEHPQEGPSDMHLSKYSNHEQRSDYQNGGSQFCAALDKFTRRYHASKAISFTRLSSSLYNSNADPTRIKSGAMIRVQIESTKRRNSESSGTRRKLHTKARTSKENLDPQTIPSRKKSKYNKKEHNLAKNISNNQLN